MTESPPWQRELITLLLLLMLMTEASSKISVCSPRRSTGVDGMGVRRVRHCSAGADFTVEVEVDGSRANAKEEEPLTEAPALDLCAVEAWKP